MIPLKFMQKSQSEQDKLVGCYIEKLFEHTDAAKIKLLDQWCSQYLTQYAGQCSFRQLVGMTYKDMVYMKKQLDQIPEAARLPSDLTNYVKSTLYERHVPRDYLIEILGETVCPYCNRMYINRSNNHAVCQFDHFFDKSTYPILAVSFYNLIPCCATCNLIKKQQKLGYSPYDKSVRSTDQMLEFDYKALTYAQMSGVAPPSAILINCLDQRMEENIKALELEDLYQIHTREVQELINKRKIYGERYADFLNEHYSDIGMSVEQFIVGSYIDPEDYGKQPLSKMKTDISKRIKLI